MLIQPDKQELGDSRLDPKEGVAKLKEENRKLEEKYKLPRQEQLTDRAASLGQVKEFSTFVSELRKLDPKIIVEDGGYPGAVAVRYPALNDEGKLYAKYVTGFFKQPLSEWSLILEDEHGRPKRHMRGWRTVLLDLMNQGIVSFPQIRKAFGDPLNQRSFGWEEQTQVLR